MRRFATILLLPLLAGCQTDPEASQRDGGNLPKVRNIRPNVPNERATLAVQAETIFLRLDADTSEIWSFVASDGLDPASVKMWEENGVRIGTVDAVSMTQFLAKLPRTGGSKKITIGAGREPVVLETTPTLERAVEVRTMLGSDRDETVKLPAGRMQLVLDVVLRENEVKATLTPHHHWVETTINPRTPDEKALDGRMFKELALEADLSEERLLVVAWKPPEKAPPPAPRLPAAPPRIPTAREPENPTDPSSADPAAPIDPPREVPAIRERSAAGAPPKIGDVLLTGTRAGKPLQLICVIRIPRQGEALPVAPVRPD